VIVIAVAASAAHHAPPAAAAGNVAATTPAASTPAATAAATARAAAAPEQSPSKRTVPLITYVVTGTATGAQVTYGPEGTDLTGHVPMRITKHLGTAMYYAIQAQLQGGGHVTVKIEINGKVISSGTADGGYNIAMAEISQDPVTGQWEDTQG
jgi:hypothetical protein